jgi:hypothetical protein
MPFGHYVFLSFGETFYDRHYCVPNDAVSQEPPYYIDYLLVFQHYAKK